MAREGTAIVTRHGTGFGTLLAAALLAAGCTAIQTTSGEAWLARHQADARGGLDPAFAAAAAVEPRLRFPARIGIAHLESGTIAPIPAADAAAWNAAAEALGPEFGTFVPVNRLIAELLSGPEGAAITGTPLARSMRLIRLAAARQHLDAVLIYESAASTDVTKNVLAMADITLVGMFVVLGQDIEVQAAASALLIDVAQAYPYLEVQATASDGALATSYSAGDTGRTIAARLREEAVAKVAADAVPAFRALRERLAERSR